jgi:hypothetical protein
MAESITLTLNLGPNASVQAVSSAVDDMMRVLDFATALQRRVDRGALVTARVLRRARWAGSELPGLGFFYVPGAEWVFSGGPGGPVDDFERIAARESDENSRITVERLTYENPLELVILAGGLVTIGVLRLLRDWPDRRRLNRAAATEYENKVIFRQRVRDRVLEQIDSRELPLTPELVEDLLTDDVADALGALGDGPLTISGLPSSDTADKTSDN